MILFCEYVVPAENREAYLSWIRRRPELWARADILENETQSGVFVEIWPAKDEAEAERLKKERLEGRPEWRELEQWIRSGRQGLRAWTFRPIRKDG